MISFVRPFRSMHDSRSKGQRNACSGPIHLLAGEQVARAPRQGHVAGDLDTDLARSGQLVPAQAEHDACRAGDYWHPGRVGVFDIHYRDSDDNERILCTLLARLSILVYKHT